MLPAGGQGRGEVCVEPTAMNATYITNIMMRDNAACARKVTMKTGRHTLASAWQEHGDIDGCFQHARAGCSSWDVWQIANGL